MCGPLPGVELEFARLARVGGATVGRGAACDGPTAEGEGTRAAAAEFDFGREADAAGGPVLPTLVEVVGSVAAAAAAAAATAAALPRDAGAEGEAAAAAAEPEPLATALTCAEAERALVRSGGVGADLLLAAEDDAAAAAVAFVGREGGTDVGGERRLEAAPSAAAAAADVAGAAAGNGGGGGGGGRPVGVGGPPAGVARVRRERVVVGCCTAFGAGPAAIAADGGSTAAALLAAADLRGEARGGGGRGGVGWTTVAAAAVDDEALADAAAAAADARGRSGRWLGAGPPPPVAATAVPAATAEATGVDGREDDRRVATVGTGAVPVATGPEAAARVDRVERVAGEPGAGGGLGAAAGDIPEERGARTRAGERGGRARWLVSWSCCLSRGVDFGSGRQEESLAAIGVWVGGPKEDEVR